MFVIHLSIVRQPAWSASLGVLGKGNGSSEEGTRTSQKQRRVQTEVDGSKDQSLEEEGGSPKCTEQHHIDGPEK